MFSTHTRITENSGQVEWMARDSLELYRRRTKTSIKLEVRAKLRSFFRSIIPKNNRKQSSSAKQVQFQSKCQNCGKWRHGTTHSHNYCCVDLTLFPWVSVDEGRVWNPVGPYDPS